MSMDQRVPKSDENCRQHTEQALQIVFENEAPDIQFLVQIMAEMAAKLQNTVCRLPDSMIIDKNTGFYTGLKQLPELDLRLIPVRGILSNPDLKLVVEKLYEHQNRA